MSSMDPRDVRLRARVLGAWPWPVTADRRGSPFRAGGRTPGAGFWTSTERLLRHEAAMLGADELVLELDLDLQERDVRADGWIRADARPRSPRVVVALRHPTLGWLRYHCDQYTTGPYSAQPSWQANVRAIALSLEALRAVDRHGVTGKGEQYLGFKQLPASTSPVVATVEDAAAVLADESDETDEAVLTDVDAFRRAYRAAVRATHPDREGGTADAFHRVQAARRLLDVHHGCATTTSEA